jgi:uncharacterized metal-binding protein
MNMAETDHASTTAPRLIFACSGAADVGEIADRAARRLAAEGKGKMFCMAGIGGRVPPIMETIRAAEKILAVDGCQLDCVRCALEQAGLGGFVHVRVTDLGMEKGKSPATEECIAKVAGKVESLL